MRFELPQLPVASGTAFFKISKNKQPRYVYPNFRKLFPRSFLSIQLLSQELLEFSVEWFAFRKFNSFWDFWKPFREISVPFAAVYKFSKVLVKWKAPLVTSDLRLAFLKVFDMKCFCLFKQIKFILHLPLFQRLIRWNSDMARSK